MSSVDVVVVTYRSADRLAACLGSIPVDPGVHLWVVDNGSSDAAPAIARSFGATVVVNEDNRGFAAAANQGARFGASPIILFLNPDARLPPKALDALLARFIDDRVAVVGAQLVHPDGRPQRSWWPYPSPRQMWAEAFGLTRLASTTRGFAVGACFAVRRPVFEALGGFDERYWLYGEESDLCYRAERAGWRIALADDAVVEHDGGASGEGSSGLVAEHFARGADRFVHTHHGRAALVSYRLAGLLASAMRWPALWWRDAEGDRLAVRSRQIRRTGRVLLRHPTRPVADPPRPGTAQLVVCSLEAWDEVWRRNQFLVRELLAADPALRVLFVEPPHDLVHACVRRRRLVLPPRRRLGPAPGFPRVERYRPWKVLPRVIWPGVDRSLAGQVLAEARRHGFQRALLWVNDPAYLELVRRVDWRATYDITDDWLDAAQSPRARRRLERQERRLLATVDQVVVCSEELRRRRRGQRDAVLVPNAVDVEHLRRPRPRPADLPAAPVVVYVGTLHEDRLDVALVAELAAARPDVAFVLVGPDALGPSSSARLAAVPNAQRLGARPYAEVPGYLQHADVVLVPHVVSAFTESLDPIKAYECLAVGRPTVATPVAGFRDLGPPVVVAARDRVGDALDDALRAAAPAVVRDDVPSWAQRARDFRDALIGHVPSANTGRRHRVVFLDHTAKSSGGELALARLLPGLAHTDAHVILGEDGPLVERLRGAGARVELLPMDDVARTVARTSVLPGRLPRRAVVGTGRHVWRLRRRLRELQPDVVHTNSLKSAIYGGVAARLARVPVVWHVHDRIASDYLPAPVAAAVRGLSRVLPNAVIANSQATLSTLAQTNRAAVVVGSPVVHDPVPSTPVTGPPVSDLIGMVGRLSPWKGQDLFLRAFAEAFPDGPHRAVVIGGALFGEDEYADSLQQLVRDLGIEARVEFTGHVEDVMAQLERLSIVVHASVLPEPFGQVVVEAMAAGRPVIATAAGGPLEVIRDGYDGLLVPPGDVSAMARAMRRLADDELLRRRLAEHGRVRVGDFAPERLGPQVERVYRRVAR